MQVEHALDVRRVQVEMGDEGVRIAVPVGVLLAPANLGQPFGGVGLHVVRVDLLQFARLASARTRA